MLTWVVPSLVTIVQRYGITIFIRVSVSNTRLPNTTQPNQTTPKDAVPQFRQFEILRPYHILEYELAFDPVTLAGNSYYYHRIREADAAGITIW
jgi:hypothetical protein